MMNKESELKLHLYFHNDFDGVAAAAILMNFIEGRGGKALSFNVIDYNPRLKPKWASFRFKKPFAILDFLYHPKASWWFDHHQTSFIRNDWQDKFKSDKTHAFGPAEKSACSLLIKRLRKDFDYKPPKNIGDLAKWATIIDSVAYKSAREAVESRQPAILIARALDSVTGRHLGAMVRKLSEKLMSEVAKNPIIEEETRKIALRNRTVKRIFGSISVLTPKVIFADGSKIKTELPRYMGYLLYPRIDYVVTVEFYGNYYHLSIGKNPWKKTPARVHIGEMLKKYGGGGHKTVGGVEKKSKKEILKIAGEVIEYLNGHG